MDKLKDLLRASPLPLLETHMLWQKVLSVSRAWLITHDDEQIAAEYIDQYHDLLQRRIDGEPMAYIMGAKEFFGYNYIVTPDVLIPRPETELLVQSALDYIAAKSAPRVLDLGTGSGAIAITIALQCPDADVYALDYSAAALQVAQMNAHKLGVSPAFYQADWYDTGLAAKLPKNHFDVIVANPPYVGATDSHLQQGDLRFEPKQALTDFADGMTAIRTIISGAADYLAQPGALMIEHGWDQGEIVRALFAQYNFLTVTSQKDLAGIERITSGHL